MRVLMCIALSASLTACSNDGGTPSPEDTSHMTASPADDGGPTPAVDMRPPTPMVDMSPVTPDAQSSPIQDAGPLPAPTPEPCIDSGQVTLNRTQVDLFDWGGDAPPTTRIQWSLSGELCAPLRATSSDGMLQVALTDDALLLWVNRDELRSGIYDIDVHLVSGESEPLATLEVTLSAWARAPEMAPRHAFLIGIDGVRSDAFQVAHTPHMDRLAHAGDWTLNASTQLGGPTLSGPGWASILTGVEVDKHGVTNNGSVTLDAEYPSFLTRLRNDLGVRTAGALQWAPLLAMVGPEALDEGTTGDHDTVTADMARMLGEDYQALFIHFDDVDHEGHATGFSIDNPAYLESIERVDEAIGELMNSLLSRPHIGEEEWMLVVTTDHGGRGTGHGPRDPEHWRIPYVITGPTTVRGTLGVTNHMDAAAALLAHMGYPLHTGLGLDGQPGGVPGEFNCEDDIDNDGNGHMDCADPQCETNPACGGGLPEAACQNQRDDDGDGLMDCEDPDCAGGPQCDVECQPLDLNSAVGRAVYSGDLNEAGSSVLASACGGGGGLEQMLRWVVPNDGTYLFNTFDSNFDTVLYLRAGECVGAELACNRQAFGSIRMDTPLPFQSAIQTQLDAGQELSIILDSAGASGDRAVLDIIERAAQCPDGDLEGAVGMNVANGENTDAPTRYLAGCAGTARDAVYLWTAPNDGDYVFDTFGSEFDTVLYVMEGACGDVEVACNDDVRQLLSSVTLNDVTAGTTYTIGVAGFRGRNGRFQLNISAIPAD